MKPFAFRGEIPASKSMMNRAFVLQSHFPQIEIRGESNCDDVRHMKNALAALKSGAEIHCGEAGTVIRFMGFRASRESGSFQLTGSPRLLKRPQADLIHLLGQLSVSCEIKTDRILIQGQGWKKPERPIQASRSTSSQFATALLLNSWNLPFDLEFEMKVGVSEGYWDMSLQMVRDLGMTVNRSGDLWKIPAHQKPKKFELAMEPDYSSAFAIAAAGALAGEACISNATKTSAQPDFRFISMMREMKVPVEFEGMNLIVRKTEKLKPLHVSLNTSPDLFPVLSVLCAFAEGESILADAPHLAHKESDRIGKTAELLKKAGFECSVQADGMRIQGQGSDFKAVSFDFDPDEDHRMAMAAGLLKLKGFKIRISHPEVVNKSFPEFWQALGVRP